MEQVKGLPQNKEAEQIVLGCMLLDSDSTAIDVISRLEEEDFYEPKHQTIYHAIITLFRHDALIDTVTVANELEEEGKLERIGGRMYLNTLLDKIVTTSMVEHYAEIVRKKADLRRIIMAGMQLATLGHKEDQDIDEAKDSALEIVSRAIMHGEDDSIVHVSEVAEDYLSRLRSLRRGQVPGTTTGFPSLDQYIFGLDGKLMVIAAYTSVGKSVMMQNMALRQARKGIPVAYISLEMTSDPIMERFFQMQGKLTREDIRYGDKERLLKVAKQIVTWPLWIVKMHDNALMSVLRQMKQLVMRHDVKVIHVDYLQKIRGSGGQKRWEQVGEITRELSAFAKKEGIGVVAGSQVKRESASEKRGPKLWDMRESGDIEQDSNAIIGLYRAGYENPEVDAEEMEVEILKNREGPAGAKKKFQFFVKQQRIEESVFYNS